MQLNPHYDKNEWKIVYGVIIIALFLTSLPYVYAWFTTPSHLIYLGTHLVDNNDAYTYLSWIQQAKNGAFTFRELYSSEAQAAIFFHPIFLLLGFSAKIFHISSVVAFHIARVLFGAIFLVTSYKFISIFTDRKKLRILTLLLLVFSTGLGFLFQSNSIDLVSIESITFLALLESPINLISLSIVLLSFIQALKMYKEFHYVNLIYFGILINLLIIVHTYDFLAVFGTLFCFVTITAISEKRVSLYKLKILSFQILISFPAIMWVCWVLNKNVALNVWANLQTNAPAASWSSYLVGYGLLLILVTIGIYYIVRDNKKSYFFIVGWLSTYVILIFNPISNRFQRKLGNGLLIPISILAAVGLGILIDFLLSRKRLKVLIGLVFVFYLSLGNFFVLTKDIQAVQAKDLPYYLDRADYNAILSYAQMSTKEDIILTEYNIGNLLPGITGSTVFMGHHDQTIDFDLKYNIAYGMLSSSVNHNDPLKLFVKQEGITYILVDDEVRSNGGLDISNRPYLKLVYNKPDLQIYAINQKLLD